MPLSSEPRPEDYGLNQATVTRLTSSVGRWEALPSRLAWVSFYVGLVCFPQLLIHAIRHGGAWWFLLGLYVLPGLLLGGLANAVRRVWAAHARRRHRLHSGWGRYQAADRAWRLVEDAEARARSLAEASQGAQQRAVEQQQLDQWTALDARGFVRETASLLQTLGYGVTLTPHAGDGGADLLVQDGARRIAVQCQAHGSSAPPGALRDLYRTVTQGEADEAWLVTTSGYYSGARTLVHDSPLRLVTIQELLARESSETSAIGSTDRRDAA
jgi:hypothetical protein